MFKYKLAQVRLISTIQHEKKLLCLLVPVLCLVFQSAFAQQATQVLYRVNAGGVQIAAEPIGWGADQAGTATHGNSKPGTPSPYLTITDPTTEDLTYGVASFTGTNNTGYPDKIFTTERFSVSRSKISQTWDFPVSVSGTYKVNLLFAEVWEGAQEAGKRVFSISIENKTVAENFDAVAEAGWNTALVKSFNVEVTDGNLDINLLKGIQNPAVKGIEIIGPTGANSSLPPQFAALPLVRAEAGATIDATFSTIEPDGDDIALTLVVKDQNGITINPSAYTFTDNGDGTARLVWATNPNQAIVYKATIKATDKDGSASKNFNITVSEKVTKFLYRINVGGPALKDASDSTRMVFSADSQADPSEYVNAGAFFTTNKAVTVNTSVPAYVPLALFKTERFSDGTGETAMHWSFPVDEGTTANVRVYLSEIYLTEENADKKRLFNIIINEDTVERGINVYEEVGNYVGLMRSYNVTSNGAIDITFEKLLENPSVKGIEIIEVKPLTLTFSKQDATCFGGTGSASVTPTGGTGPYTINWGNSIDPQSLLAGTYKVTVTDASGQTKSVEIPITQPEKLVLALETKNASDQGGTDGTATATVTGGTKPYSFNWGDGVNPNALGAGNYTVIVTDANGCSITEEFTIGDPASLAVAVKTTNPSCFGGTGTATLNISGGVEPYTTAWQNNADPTALLAGQYTVTVTDANDSSVQKTVVITQPETPLTIEVNAVDASYFGATDGSASLVVSGGTKPYNVLWGSNNSNALAAGTYYPKVVDGAGCEKEVEVVINEPAGLTIQATIINATCDATGSVTLEIDGGTFPYDTIWSDNVNPGNLPAGTYKVTISDANNASVTQQIVVEDDCALGIGDNGDEAMEFKLYPVPGDGTLNVSIPKSLSGQKGTIRIFAATGQKMLEEKTQFLTDKAIDVSKLNKGTYILETTVGGKSFKRRFVITR